jgi:hypothetical protein
VADAVELLIRAKTLTAEASKAAAADIQKLGASSAEVNVRLRAVKDAGVAADRALSEAFGEPQRRRAEAVAAAIQSVGGVTRLTDGEAKRHLSTLDAWVQKSQHLGTEVSADMLKTRNALASVAQPTSRAAGLFGDLGTQVKATALGFLSAQAIVASVRAGMRALTEFVSGSVEAYAQQEAATKKLVAALTAQGTATPALISQYQALASQFQKTTVYGDELLMEMQSLLAEIGNVAPRNMGKALTAATDLASGLGIDLKTATMLVGKAFAGETGTLKRYGIVIDEAKLKAEGMPAVLDAIQSRFGGQAAADIDTYAGKVKQLANAWGDVKEAVGKAIVEDELLKQALRAIAGQMDDLNAAAAQSQPTITEWWARLSGGPHVALAIRYIQIVQRAISETNAGVRDLRSKVATPVGFEGSAGPQARDESAIIERELAHFDARIKRLKETKAEAERAAEAIDKYVRALAKGEGLPGIGLGLSGAIGMKFDVPDIAKQLEVMSQGMKAGGALRSLPGIEIPITLPKNINEQIARQLTQAEFGQKLAGSVMAAIQGGGNVLDAAGGTIGTSVMSGLAKRLTTVKDGAKAALSGWLGGAASAVLPMVGSLLGPLAGAVSEKLIGMFDRNKGRDAVKEFAESMGGFESLHARLGTLGPVVGEKLWKGLTHGVGRNNPQQAKSAIDAITAALGQADAKNAAFNATLGGMLGKIQSLGGGLSESLRGYLDSLRQGKGLTQENLDLLASLSSGGVANWQQIEEAVGRYGGEISKLGGTFQEARLHDSWQQIIDDMDLFQRGGVSAGDALDLTKAKVQELVQQSMAFGTEIPENVKGWIQTLITSGQLLDANGQKISDINSLKFGESLQTTIASLTAAIRELVAQFNAVPAAIGRIPSTIDIDVRARKSGDGWDEPQTGDIQSHADGAFVRRDHVARIHEGEFVGSPDFMAGVMADAMAARGGGGRGGGEMTVRIPVILDGRQVTEVVARRLGAFVNSYGVS